MDTELLKKIKADLVKSGFHSEMQAIQAFLFCGWSCQGGFSYFDKDQNKSREGDLYAYFGQETFYKRSSMLQCWYRIVGEVKKSNSPWVVFKRNPPQPIDTIEMWNSLTYRLNLPCKPSRIADKISEHSLAATKGWRGYGIHESFKKPTNSSSWYSAFMSAAKGAEGALESEKSTIEAAEPAFENLIYFTLIKPLVILDGILLSAELDNKGEIHIEEIESAAFLFDCKTSNYHREHYCIDVVTLKNLSSYITLAEQRLLSIFEAIAANVNERKECSDE